MDTQLTKHNWKISEEKFLPQQNRIVESLMSIGNGRFGGRATFEEYYSGDSMLGNYVAGVYYPDPTRVGWWKNGYPDSFAKVLNAADWTALDIIIDNERLDLNNCVIDSFERSLDMRSGTLNRCVRARTRQGKRIRIDAQRFASIANDTLGALQYTLTLEEGPAKLEIAAILNHDIHNTDANDRVNFWEITDITGTSNCSHVCARTRKTEFDVCTATHVVITKDGEKLPLTVDTEARTIAHRSETTLKSGESITITKLVSIISSLMVDQTSVTATALQTLSQASTRTFSEHLDEHRQAWQARWQKSDIKIEGDVAAQQGIRFNLFQLYQTYTGRDPQLNIGPKGFTGEKYGGCTYWDTEMFCLPFYLNTSAAEVSRQLLLYRYKQLPQAIDNAKKLGFSKGAALYPMVTMNGEECHNEWEITFEEIHRNGAIIFAIYNYVCHSDDRQYLADYGFEVILAVARFWAQRAHQHQDGQSYMIIGVTGPNEYENNIDNNFYTNVLAQWCLAYAVDVSHELEKNWPQKYSALIKKTHFDAASERTLFTSIAETMYLPYDHSRQLYLQQDNYLNKENCTVDDLNENDRPLCQKWSWDRILRSPFIKQADTLQAFYLFPDRFDKPSLKRHFEFYEPRTVHESSLSPCIHGVLSARLGNIDDCYRYFLQTARLDLDNVNNDTEDGCHITSMAGSWITLVEGMGGLRIVDEKISLVPQLPSAWQNVTFTICFRGHVLSITMNHTQIVIQNQAETAITLDVFKEQVTVEANDKTTVPMQL